MAGHSHSCAHSTDKTCVCDECHGTRHGMGIASHALAPSQHKVQYTGPGTGGRPRTVTPKPTKEERTKARSADVKVTGTKGATAGPPKADPKKTASPATAPVKAAPAAPATGKPAPAPAAAKRRRGAISQSNLDKLDRAIVNAGKNSRVSVGVRDQVMMIHHRAKTQQQTPAEVRDALRALDTDRMSQYDREWVTSLRARANVWVDDAKTANRRQYRDMVDSAPGASGVSAGTKNKMARALERRGHAGPAAVADELHGVPRSSLSPKDREFLDRQEASLRRLAAKKADAPAAPAAKKTTPAPAKAAPAAKPAPAAPAPAEPKRRRGAVSARNLDELDRAVVNAGKPGRSVYISPGVRDQVANIRQNAKIRQHTPAEVRDALRGLDTARMSAADRDWVRSLQERTSVWAADAKTINRKQYRDMVDKAPGARGVTAATKNKMARALEERGQAGPAAVADEWHALPRAGLNAKDREFLDRQEASMRRVAAKNAPDAPSAPAKEVARTLTVNTDGPRTYTFTQYRPDPSTKRTEYTLRDDRGYEQTATFGPDTPGGTALAELRKRAEAEDKRNATPFGDLRSMSPGLRARTEKTMANLRAKQAAKDAEEARIAAMPEQITTHQHEGETRTLTRKGRTFTLEGGATLGGRITKELPADTSTEDALAKLHPELTDVQDRGPNATTSSARHTLDGRRFEVTRRGRTLTVSDPVTGDEGQSRVNPDQPQDEALAAAHQDLMDRQRRSAGWAIERGSKIPATANGTDRPLLQSQGWTLKTHDDGSRSVVARASDGLYAGTVSPDGNQLTVSKVGEGGQVTVPTNGDTTRAFQDAVARFRQDRSDVGLTDTPSSQRTRDNDRRSMEQLTDENLALEFADALGTDDHERTAAAEAEINRRDALAQYKGGNAWLEEPNDQGKKFGEDRPLTEDEKRVDALIARGWSYLDAYAEVHGHSDADLREQAARAQLGGGTRKKTDAALRQEYQNWVHLQWLEAEKATRGNLLSRAGQSAGKDPVTLFSGPVAVARKHASEELQTWWQAHPRLTFTQFKAQILGRAEDKAAAERTRLASNGRNGI